MRSVRAVLLGLFVVAIVVSVAVMPEGRSCKTECVGGGSSIASMVWLAVAITALLMALILQRLQRHTDAEL